MGNQGTKVRSCAFLSITELVEDAEFDEDQLAFWYKEFKEVTN